MAERSSAAIPRRAIVAGAGVALAGAAGFAASRRRTASPTTPQVVGSGVTAWQRNSAKPLLIGHRGAGVVVPEHTIEAYRQALAWGAGAIEISTALTQDGVLYCLHDLDLERTTTLTGAVARHSAADLADGRVSVPRLGPKWQGSGRPRIPRLSEALDVIGSRAVLCVESKNDDGFDQMLDAIRRSGLTDSVMIKLHLPSRRRIQQARDAGFPVFAYAGGAEDLTVEELSQTARLLDAARDALVIPVNVGDKPVSDAELARALGQGIQVWAYPVTRRVERDRLVTAGVTGLITPDLRYLTDPAPLTQDTWATRAISYGELTRNPYSDTLALTWPQEGVLGVDFPGRQSFVLLGQLSPLPETFTLEVDLCFDPLPKEPTASASIAFGRADDSYYEHRLGQGAGHHVIVRANGDMGVFEHRDGVTEGIELATPVTSSPLAAGDWVRMRLTVDDEGVTWGRVGGPSVTGKVTHRGGYLHVGRSGGDGGLRLRNLRVS